MTAGRLAVCALLTVSIAVVTAQCSPPPAAAPASTVTARPPVPELTPVLSIRELMAHVIDPTADWIFDAAVVEVSATGTSTTLPASADDWLKVERGLLTLAESANLLKIPRPVAPDGTPEDPIAPGEPAPELSPAEIGAKIDEDRARWNRYVDDLRAVALASLLPVRSRDPEVLFKVGGDIDEACEACHLEYWYPGDKPAVLRGRGSTVTIEPPGAAR